MFNPYWLNTFLVILLALLQVADGVTTYRILKKGGRELNPLVKGLMDEFGLIPGLVIAKSTPLLIFAMLVLTFGSTDSNLTIGLLVLVGFYSAVVFRNFKQMRK